MMVYYSYLPSMLTTPQQLPFNSAGSVIGSFATPYPTAIIYNMNLNSVTAGSIYISGKINYIYNSANSSEIILDVGVGGTKTISGNTLSVTYTSLGLFTSIVSNISADNGFTKQITISGMFPITNSIFTTGLTNNTICLNVSINNHKNPPTSPYTSTSAGGSIQLFSSNLYATYYP